MWLYFKPKYVEKGRERRKTKIIVPFRSYPTRNRKFIKQLQKKFKKNRQLQLWLLFKQKLVGNGRER